MITSCAPFVHAAVDANMNAHRHGLINSLVWYKSDQHKRKWVVKTVAVTYRGHVVGIRSGIVPAAAWLLNIKPAMSKGMLST